jgi:hypothetical protein
MKTAIAMTPPKRVDQWVSVRSRSSRHLAASLLGRSLIKGIVS